MSAPTAKQVAGIRKRAEGGSNYDCGIYGNPDRTVLLTLIDSLSRRAGEWFSVNPGGIPLTGHEIAVAVDILSVLAGYSPASVYRVFASPASKEKRQSQPQPEEAGKE